MSKTNRWRKALRIAAVSKRSDSKKHLERVRKLLQMMKIDFFLIDR
jgi:hypothetical protein